MKESLQTIEDLLNYAERAFIASKLYYGHGTDNAWDEAVYLVLYALGLPPDSERERLSENVSLEQCEKALALIQQRIDKRIPVAYLVNEAWFAGLSFYVDERVMIPRSPIAELIGSGFAPWMHGKKVGRILDLCTGSACLAVACAKAFPNAKVDAVDLSKDAIAVAEKNIARHHVENQVRLFCGDLFKPLQKEQYDIIVSNPPYVGEQEFSQLPDEYYHEPDMAFVSDDDGLEIVSNILRQASEYLTDQGILIVEVGNSEHALADRYPQLPFVWLEFERGGHGVFLLHKLDLLAMEAD